ncbi:TetR family transcriptional regulator [Streptomyces sp. NBC_01187]|uniref:TetR family transcriptional regulator n=1 Tax=Streptomyces sp. NBC_01187 TaxID=2903766 RepID=UPI00386CCDC3|nr:TetR/AcrR family transcriptional regulator [Streptomyces sp. NBC_01187]
MLPRSTASEDYVVKQERAHQTRRALLRAAASEFYEHGYAGTSLSRVTKRAGTTMGALTFHFPTKGELADAVSRDGAEAVHTTLRSEAAGAPPGLQGIIDLTHTLARLLEGEPVVRASARLAREREGADATWYSAWAPVLREQLDHAQQDGRPATDAGRRAITALVQHLVVGSEVTMQTTFPLTQPRAATAREQLASIWELLLSDVLPAPAVSRLDPRGSRALT